MIYADLHGHFLPGVDDSRVEWDQMSTLFQTLKNEGIRDVVCTPHVWKGRYENTPATLEGPFRRFAEEAKSAGLSPHLGCEVMYHGELAAAWGRGEIWGLAGTSFVLIELPVQAPPLGLREGLYHLRVAGAQPILAHPERYPFFQRDRSLLETLVEDGLWGQVTSASLVGLFGRGVKACAWEMVRQGLVHFMASDTHSVAGSRRVIFRQAVKALIKNSGASVARRLGHTNPFRILKGREPLTTQPVSWALLPQ